MEVEDVNDHVPQTIQPAYYPTVEEDLPPMTSVVTLEARDGDLAPSNISFTISGGDADEYFHIHRTSGLLTTTKALDRETTSRYQLEVTVSDGELSSITPVIVTVADVNDNAPEFLEPLYRVSVPARRKSRKHDPLFTVGEEDKEEEEEEMEVLEEEEEDYHEDDDPDSSSWSSFEPSKITSEDNPLCRVFAMDADTGLNSDLDYSIQTRRGKGRFKIHPKTGQVYSNKSFMPGQTFNLVIQAQDNGRPRKRATTRIIVRVSQVPDTSSHAPKVLPPTPTHVMETDPPGHFVTFIHASDPDNDTLWYYITDGDAGGRFSIGVDSGLVTVARPLDREDRDRHTLTIEVTDGVHAEKVKLVIEVLDVNDQRPVFRSRVYQASIRESSKPGDVILGLHCRDKDDPLSASSSVYYTLHHAEGTSTKELFTLDSSTGELMVAQPLDRESASDHELTVSCRDRGGNENVDYARVVITVMDENDHDPVFLENMITAQVSESVAQGTAVTRLVAIDHDRGENGRLSYSVVEGNAGGAFSMDESLGILRVARTLSRVEQSEYILLVRATDHATQPRAASVPVRVILNAAPQSPPTWQTTGQGAKVVEVSEWSTVGTAVARVSASSSSSVYYDIRQGNIDGAFTISPSSGVVRLATPLDFETTESYNLTIASTNMAGVSAITWLAIRVLDENDWWPEWDLTSYQGVTLETTPVGTLVLAAHHTHVHARKALGIDTGTPTPLTVTANDRDSGRNGRVSYSIVERTMAKYFSIDPHTGAMRVAGRLDEVAGKTVRLSVWANDDGDPRRECIVPASVTIKVTRVNHSPPIFTKPNYKTKLLLPTFNGVRVLCVNATDPDRTRELSRSILTGSVSSSGDSRDSEMTSQFTELEYELTAGDMEEKFEIDTSSGCVTVKDQVSLKSKYNLTVMVNDGAFSSDTNIEISVEEAPQSSIVFTQEQYFANVLENSTKEINVVVVGVRGTPLDHHIEFSILNPSDYFTIRPTAGVIKTTGLPFDRELKDHHTLVVQAREAERPEYVARVMVNVAVLDVNDNAPVFVNLPYHALVSTNSPRGHVITKVRAVDGDSGDNGVIRYELVRGSGELFAVNKKTGEITLKQPLMVPDKTYSLTVAAYDRGKPPLSSQAHVLLRVTFSRGLFGKDPSSSHQRITASRVVDAEGPVFSAAHYIATAPESVARGAAVARVEAASPSGAPLIYTIVAGNTYEEFTLDYTTGVKAPDAKCVIKTAAPLDYETTHTHNLTLRARDPITGSHADAQLTLTLTDVNDNAPDFTAHVYNVTVSEAAAVGQKVAKVEASDRDTGLGGLVHYSCATACDLFSIGRQDGQVSLARVLDAERERRHILTVVATDSGLPPMSSSATVIVHVSDFNDNAPVWSQRRYTCRVSPEAARGHLVTTLAAHDPDAQDTRTLHYSIHSGDSQGIFNLDSTNGLLSVVSPQKLKGIMSLNLNVSVTDGVHAAFTALHIDVASSNHNPPVFSKPLYDGRVQENRAPGQPVARVEAEDPDTGVYGDFAYSLLDVTLKDTFRIDKNGNIFTQAPLDREDRTLFTVPVAVVDAGGRADFAQVRVVVEDANDNSPVFTLPSYQANVPVNVAPGTIILKVEAEDEDEGLNREIVYRMYEADNSEALNLFKVHPKTGRVTLAASARGRETEVYQFFIRAEDKGTPSRNSDVPVTIFLLSADDQPPHCSRPYGQFFLPEDAAIGTVVTSLWVDGPMPIKYSLVAKDRDEDETTLENVSEEEENDGSVSSGPFTVTSSGLLSLRWSLDREKRRTHRLTVVNQTLTTPPVVDYMTIDVVVMDVNDCVPRFTSQNYRTSVAENEDVGATVLMLTANDDDEGSNGRVQYSITEDDPNIRSTFRVDPHTGAVTLVAPLDRESTPSYSFGVEATDDGATPLSSSAQVFITVKDYNDNPPMFHKDTYVTAVPEDAAAGTVVVELEVDDEDEMLMPLDFLVSGGDSSGHFLVHASGQVYVARSLDREKQAQYALTVTATDGKFTANTTVDITVIDSNDNGPVCLEPLYKRPVSEGVAPGTHVATIAVWDADEADAARSRFSLTGEAASHFTIDQLNGQVATARRLDRETRDHYSLVVTVEDWEHPEWQCETRLEIGVGDVNDNSPEFVRGAYTATVPEDAPLNSIVTKVHATDPDLGVNRRVRYGMVDSAGGHFEVDAVEGVVSLVKPLDREHRDSYSLTLRASDQGQPALSSTVVLAVIVGDVNDNAPEFVHTLLNAVVAENTSPGTEVTRVLATSRDVGINAEITYSLLHDTEEEFLGVHPKTGVVSVTAPLDYERLQQVVVTVLATDGGTPPLSATALLNVSITDLNDNVPVFTLPTYTAMVKEDAPTSTSILQVSANDADCGENGEIEYVLQKGNDNGRFALHPETGVLTLAKQLDREQVSDYLLTVGATDKGMPPNTAVVSVTVTVQDANDNKPVFASSNYSVVVQENRPVGYSIVRLMATDADADPNGPPYTWEIIRGNSANAFTVDQDGTIRLATTRLNHRVHSSFAIMVRVWDSGSPPLSADVTVHITVVEESRYPPTVFPLQVSVITYRTAYAGGHVGKVTALDQDPYDVLQYDIGVSGSSEIKYFDIDGQDGTLVALSPLDAGLYPVNITVSDGKYERSVEARVTVKVISEDMVENAVILRLGPLSPEDFLSRYKKPFIRTLKSVLKVKLDAIHVISLQPALLHSTSLMTHNGNNRGKREAEEDDHDTDDVLRDKRGIQKSLDVLFAIEKAKNIFMPRKDIIELLVDSQKQIREQLDMPLVNVMDSVCGPETDCGGHGTCIDVIRLSEKVAVPLTTQLNSLVAPRFSQTPACGCEQGYAGDTCDELINACGRRPCAEYEECHPDETTPRGYTCQCPAGYAGPGCKIDLSKCKDLSCHYPTKPLSFKGKSYAQYTVARQAESSSLTVSVFIRTRHPVGTIVYAAGEVDYSILEVLEGYVQYRWDCGSGEGLVRVSAVKIDDQKWHSINLTRDGTIATLMVDGEKSSGAAPGNNDILNLDSNSLFLGAQVRLNQDSSSGTYTHLSLGFVGCLDRVAIGDVELPVAVTGSTAGGPALKRLANVELQCPKELPPPGVCGSQPCQNGGTCIEMKDSYTCSCPPRFTGPQCQIDTAPCASSPCLNGGRCVVISHNFECKCPSKLSGRRCEYGVYCNPNPCQNGGRCEEGLDRPLCKCQHFTGTKCELDIDECTRNPCQNGGTCLNYYGGFRCLCSTNATGEYCTEPLTIPAVTSSSLNMTLEELVCILAVFLACVLAVLVLVAWQRRRWRHKRHQQNNRIKLTDHHVKNDLKANDAPKRNSKICNVEADLQGPPVPPRPASYTPSANDSAILNTLKHLADLSGTGHESLELETLSRCSHEFIHSLTKPVAAPPNLSPPPPSDTDSLHKPWAHHNNLNESYFTPVKASDMGCGLTVRLDDSRTSPSLQSEFTDDTSVTSGYPPPVPPRREGASPASLSSFGAPSTSSVSPPLVLPPVPPSVPPLPRNYREFAQDLNAHLSRKVYHWDDYDMRECGTLLTG
ncbi:fat-like cadherin-related tumor suppressor homolog, partial [Oratosquilla oratoria]|uniref:fat-like cadherin-related tumor suppressor homolog n=1 Tax=Oratosquilla oratoria TaxID=337810 RepID=UPI003F767519